MTTDSSAYDVAQLLEYVTTWIDARKNAADADAMNRYLRLEDRGDPIRCFGVKKSAVRDLQRDVKKNWVPPDAERFERAVRSLFASPHREVRSLGAELVRFWPRFSGSVHLPLYEELIRTGGWWDLVDIVAASHVPRVFIRERAALQPTIESWIHDDNMWIRRAALISQLHAKEDVDLDLLFRFCRACMHEKEWFIRKAIGWALRDASRANPDAIIAFLEQHRADLSGLSLREGAKHLVRVGALPAP